MTAVLEIRRRGRQVAGALLGCLLVAYFLFHTIQGERGLFAWVQLNQQISQAETENTRILNDRLAWENRIRLLRTEGLDADLLDERVRLVAGLGSRDEFVIYLSENAR